VVGPVRAAGVAGVDLVAVVAARAVEPAVGVVVPVRDVAVRAVVRVAAARAAAATVGPGVMVVAGTTAAATAGPT
jgi:hypothetical protein